jgi:hypothetical protein
METHKSSSYELSILDDNIAELVIYENTEFDAKMVDEFHEFIARKMVPPVSVLVNKLYSYSYSYEALKALSRSRKIKSVAVASYGKSSTTINYIMEHFNPCNLPVKIFSEKALALQWLRDGSLN